MDEKLIQNETLPEVDDKPWKPTTVMKKIAARLEKCSGLDSVSEFCRKAEVSRPSYYRVIDDPQFIAWIDKRRDKQALQRRAMMDKAVFATGLSGGSASQKLFYQIHGYLVEKSQVEVVEKKKLEDFMR